ncbi:hypothetical protein DXD59_10095 [Olsenella sp. TM06-36]|nr:hypothetical protein DXD59_10095 [Olsenella sp. TM06-36]RHJ91174.1 hypothetical protein DW092_09950 [Olsenella sp. AM05-7]RHJ96679.1 hypothetical protein DW090_10145 [Olsenella sp. AM05-17]
MTVTGWPEVTRDAERDTPEKDHEGLDVSAVLDAETSLPEESADPAASAMEGTPSAQATLTAKTIRVFLHLIKELMRTSSGITTDHLQT